MMTNWFPSVLWHCWFSHLACNSRPRNDQWCVEWYYCYLIFNLFDLETLFSMYSYFLRMSQWRSYQALKVMGSRSYKCNWVHICGWNGFNWMAVWLAPWLIDLCVVALQTISMVSLYMSVLGSGTYTSGEVRHRRRVTSSRWSVCFVVC